MLSDAWPGLMARPRLVGICTVSMILPGSELRIWCWWFRCTFIWLDDLYICTESPRYCLAQREDVQAFDDGVDGDDFKVRSTYDLCPLNWVLWIDHMYHDADFWYISCRWCKIVQILESGWQKLAAFRRGQKRPQKFSSGTYLLFLGYCVVIRVIASVQI